MMKRNSTSKPINILHFVEPCDSIASKNGLINVTMSTSASEYFLMKGWAYEEMKQSLVTP